MALFRLRYDLQHNGPFFIGQGDEDDPPSLRKPDALALNIGDSTYPIKSSVSGNAVNLRSSFSHTSGDARAAYIRLTLTGSSGGEAIRAFTNVNASLTTARGAHISLNFGSSGAVSGLATALSATLHIPNTGTVTGNVAAIEAQAWLDSGDDDDVSMATEHGLIRCTVSGDSGNAAAVTNLLHVSVDDNCVGNKAAALMVCNADVTGGGGAASGGLQVRVEGTNYWIPLYSL